MNYLLRFALLFAGLRTSADGGYVVDRVETPARDVWTGDHFEWFAEQYVLVLRGDEDGDGDEAPTIYVVVTRREWCEAWTGMWLNTDPE